MLFLYQRFKKIVIVNDHRRQNLVSMRVAMSWLRNITGSLSAITDPQ